MLKDKKCGSCLIKSRILLNKSRRIYEEGCYKNHKGFELVLFSPSSNCYTWKSVKHICREPDKLLTKHVKKVGQVAHSLAVGRCTEKKWGKTRKEKRKKAKNRFRELIERQSLQRLKAPELLSCLSWFKTLYLNTIWFYGKCSSKVLCEYHRLVK